MRRSCRGRGDCDDSAVAPALREGPTITVGWAGVVLTAAGDGRFRCPRTGARYVQASETPLEEMS